ncbi:transcriptional regulatory protein YycF [bacterium BMS3Abin03]|nr:transcriptional regulatory protein YycF [bacterium BMS3Abin03]
MNVDNIIKKKILVVEDNSETQLIIKVNLRDDYDVEIVDNANDALELLKKKHFDLVILDVNLQGEEDGKAVLEKIRGELNLGTLPVIVTTAYDLKEEDKNILMKISNAYIEKPLEKENLLASIKKCLKAVDRAAN